jgi:hypothetical protein
LAAHLQSSSRRAGINISSTWTRACMQQPCYASIIMPVQAPFIGSQHTAGSCARKQQHLVSPANRRPVSSSTRRSNSAPLDDSSSGSDSDSDAAVVVVNPSDLDADGVVPWYHTDSEVQAAWRIQDEQEMEDWQDIAASLEK